MRAISTPWIVSGTSTSGCSSSDRVSSSRKNGFPSALLSTASTSASEGSERRRTERITAWLSPWVSRERVIWVAYDFSIQGGR